MDGLASLPPDSQAAIVEAIVDGYTAILYTRYMATGGFALVVADYIHTFSEEVRLMWFAPLTIPKVLFFVVRYYVLVNNIFGALILPGGIPAGYSCKSAFIGSAISSPLVVVGAEGILFYRVYGFSGRSRWMLVYLIFQFIVIHVSSFILLARYLETLVFIQWPTPKMECMPFKANAALLGGVFAALLCSVFITMVIMVFVAYRKHRGINSTLMQAFYRDGIFYFICLSALASANIAVSFAASSGYNYLFTQPEINAHAILATRMLLHLRDIASREDAFTRESGLWNTNDRIPMRFRKPRGVIVTTNTVTSHECSQAAAAKALVDIYRAVLHTSYIARGGFALVVVDYIQTFPEEVELMWFAPLSIPKVLFFVVRYYVIVDNIFAVLFAPGRGTSANECKAAFTRSAISSPLLVVGAEAILFYRVYAFSGRGRWMLIYLLLQFITIHVTSFIFFARYLGSLEFINWPLPKTLCVPFKADLTLLAGVFTALLASVIIAMLIMMFVAYRKHRGLNSTLLQVFYRDGVFYFICLSALASANIAMSFAASNGYKYFLAQIEIDAHAILATRMLLHLRNIANRETQSTMGSVPSGFQGRIPVRANRNAAKNPRSPMHLEGVPRYPRRDSLREPMATTDTDTWFHE